MILLQAFHGVIEKISSTDKQRIARYLLYLIITGDIDGLARRILNDPIYCNLFNETELQEIRKEASLEDLDIPNLLLKDEWGIEPVDYIRKNLHYVQTDFSISVSSIIVNFLSFLFYRKI